MPDTSAPTEIEEVVLLNEAGQAIGSAPKDKIHGRSTPLHSAFSIFLFNLHGEMLIQQRAWTKQTWPGIWSNACCGHPMPGEALEHAAQRRLRQELGLRGISLRLALPDFRYRASYQGIEENEICPVFIGLCSQEPQLNPTEVAALDWINWAEFLSEEADPTKLEDSSYSPWSRLEAAALGQWSRQHPLGSFVAQR
ncbi:isopentenyl-diphosphate Delta-isomerase [Coraliomargarita parva]|uniref:isopentenyl-diphosphate Delta-isomerase n=1 Tax=Coraliomargarita parva TaxID=3014050 RepID=UPI0022B4B523|nr:isopentenyl-diphosphate Delta-isomerase [Coraliomargarita parva]